MIKRQAWRKEGKRVIPLWNVIWKVFLESQLRKRSWKKNIPFLLFGKKSFRHLYYQFQFQLVLFRLRLKTLWFKPPNENSFEGHKLISNVQLLLQVTLIKQSLLLTYSTVLNYLFHWLFNARRTLTWFPVKLSQDYPHKFCEFYILNSTCDTKA